MLRLNTFIGLLLFLFFASCTPDDESFQEVKKVTVSISAGVGHHITAYGNRTNTFLILVDENEEILDQNQLMVNQVTTVETEELEPDQEVSLYVIVEEPGIGSNPKTKFLVQKFTDVEGAIDIVIPDKPRTYLLNVVLENCNIDEVESHTSNIIEVNQESTEKIEFDVRFPEEATDVYCSVKKKGDSQERYIWIEDAQKGAEIVLDYNALPLAEKNVSILFPSDTPLLARTKITAYNDSNYALGTSLIDDYDIELEDQSLLFDIADKRFEEYFVNFYLNKSNDASYQHAYLANTFEPAFAYSDIDFEIIDQEQGKRISYAANSDFDFHTASIFSYNNSELSVYYYIHGVASDEKEILFNGDLLLEFTKDYPSFNFEEGMTGLHLELTRSNEGRDLEKFIHREILTDEDKPYLWKEGLEKRW